MSATMVTPFCFLVWSRDGNLGLPGPGRFIRVLAVETSLPASIRLLISPCNALDVQQRQDNLVDSVG